MMKRSLLSGGDAGDDNNENDGRAVEEVDMVKASEARFPDVGLDVETEWRPRRYSPRTPEECEGMKS